MRSTMFILNITHRNPYMYRVAMSADNPVIALAAGQAVIPNLFTIEPTRQLTTTLPLSITFTLPRTNTIAITRVGQRRQLAMLGYLIKKPLNQWR